MGVVGPNGAGKSTLLRTLLGLLPVWEGAVAVDGAAPPAARARIGYMPQAEAVDWSFPISVRESVAIGLYRREFGWARARRIIAAPFTAPFSVSFRGADPRIEHALARVGLDGLGRQQVRELSGGQQRRALLARALVKDPPLLLLDEPLAGLDAAIEEDLLHLFRSLATDGKTLIIATHDVPCVMRYYDLALCLNRPRDRVRSPEGRDERGRAGADLRPAPGPASSYGTRLRRGAARRAPRRSRVRWTG